MVAVVSVSIIFSVIVVYINVYEIGDNCQQMLLVCRCDVLMDTERVGGQEMLRLVWTQSS